MSMTIDQIREAQIDLQRRLRDQVMDFARLTGCPVETVAVQNVECHRVEDDRPQLVDCHVWVTLTTGL